MSTAAMGAVIVTRDTAPMRPSANSPPTRSPPAFGTVAITVTCPVAGSATALMRFTVPANARPGYPFTVNSTGAPISTLVSCGAGTAAISCMLAGSTTVYSGEPGCTTSPALT